jgi:NAD(P)-dependent dehydrogenase (short-subunit alcohol dehydrogenase family)
LSGRARSSAPHARLHRGGASHVLIAFGGAGDEELALTNFAEAKRIIDVNFTSAAAWALAAANVLERQRSGTLMALGSVSSDRGRSPDYLYGAAKAGLAVLVQGLAHRLSRSGARAVLIKAGPVDAPGTPGLRRGEGPLSNPQEIASIIYRAADRGGPILYAPPAWRWRMLAVRAAPAFLLHRTRV